MNRRSDPGAIERAAMGANEGATGGGGGGGSNKSDTSVNSSSENNFWETIGESVDRILANIQSRRGGAGVSNNVVSFEEGGDLGELNPAGAADPTAAPAAGARPAAGGAAGLMGQAQQIQQQQQAAMGAVEGQEQAVAVPQRRAGGGGGGAAAQANFSLNPEAGIITVFANKRQHVAVEKYLRAVRASVMQQILIEAKIIEITLNDQYRAGVDWQAFLGPNNDIAITTNFSRNVLNNDVSTPTVGVDWANSDGDLSIAATLVKQFGTVRTLSSPRLTVVNNQTAILKVAQNQVFFEIDVQREENNETGRERITVDSEIRSVPVGLIMSVQPAADPTTKKISLGLRPSVTRITGFVADPAVALIVADINRENPGDTQNITSQIPIVEVRELDSMITMDSGQTVVMGGLMQDTSENSREGLPGAMDIPILGQAVSKNIRNSTVTELVIFIKATIVNDRGTIADEDIRLYKTFTPDPRPIAF